MHSVGNQPFGSLRHRYLMEDRNLPSSRTVEVNTAGAVIVDDSSSDSDEEYQANGSGSSNPITNGANGDSDSRDIYLPRYTEQKVSHCALDIGGSLIKIVYFSRAKGKQRESSSSSSNGWDAVTSPRQPRTPATHSRPASPGLNGRATPVPNGVLGPESLVSAANISSYFDANHQASSSSSSSSSNLRAKSASASAKPRTGSKAQRSASFTAPIPGGWLNFAKFETGDIESCIAYLNQLIETSSASHNISTSEFKARHVKIMATGGGAHLFYDKLSHDLGVEVRKEEEMECLIAGLTFFMEIPNEVFWYSDQLVHASHDPATCSQSPILPASQTLNPPPQQSLAPEELPRPSPNPPQYALVFDDRPAPHFPCLLVNIGSGVSIIKVDDYGKYERISGTSLGGGTLWGLLSLLTGAETFDGARTLLDLLRPKPDSRQTEMLALSEKGDNANVDMLVGDICMSNPSPHFHISLMHGPRRL